MVTVLIAVLLPTQDVWQRVLGCLIDSLWEHCDWFSMAVHTAADSRIGLHSCVSARRSYKHMLMATDTCEYFTLGPLGSLSLFFSNAHSHRHTHWCVFPASFPNHVCICQWVYVVKVPGFPCFILFILCESSPYVCRLTHMQNPSCRLAIETTWSQSVRARG